MKQQSQLGRFVVFAVLLVGSLAMLIPFYIMVVISLKTPHEFATTSNLALPVHPTLENYLKVLSNPNVSFRLLLRNTTLIAILNTLGVVLTSSLVAYPFARLNFRGKDRLFLLLLCTMMLPGIVTMIPTYVMFKYFRWIDTFYPLTVPAFFGGGAYNIFLLRQFFMGLPKELDEAALVTRLEQPRVQEAQAQLMAVTGPAERLKLAQAADPESVFDSIRQAIVLHHRARTLHSELKAAERALADEATEANFAWIKDVKARLESIEGTEAMSED